MVRGDWTGSSPVGGIPVVASDGAGVSVADGVGVAVSVRSTVSVAVAEGAVAPEMTSIVAVALAVAEGVSVS